MLQASSVLFVKPLSDLPSYNTGCPFEETLTLRLPFDLLDLASLEPLIQCVPALSTTHNMDIKEQAE